MGPPPHRRFFQRARFTTPLGDPAVNPRCACRSAICRELPGWFATASAINSGLRWLARHQNDDGSWSAASFADGCRGVKCEGAGMRDFDVGVTGLAVLAFLQAGIVPPNRTRYVDHVNGLTVRPGAVVKKGLQFLIAQQTSDGRIGPPIQELMYNHAIATLALTEAYGVTRAVCYGGPAERAVTFVQKAQNEGLAWRYTPRPGNNDTSVTGWCVLALESAEIAGLSVPRSSFDGAKNWVLRVTDSNGLTWYDKLGSSDVVATCKHEAWASHPTMTATGLLVRMASDGGKKGDSAMAQAAKIVSADLPKWDPKAQRPSNDVYYWFWGTRALERYDGPNGPHWRKWRKALTETLCDNQCIRKDGCADGSWPSEQVDRWGYAGGRVYATAMNILSLETASHLGSPGCPRAR